MAMDEVSPALVQVNSGLQSAVALEVNSGGPKKPRVNSTMSHQQRRSTSSSLHCSLFQ